MLSPSHWLLLLPRTFPGSGRVNLGVPGHFFFKFTLMRKLIQDWPLNIQDWPLDWQTMLGTATASPHTVVGAYCCRTPEFSLLCDLSWDWWWPGFHLHTHDMFIPCMLHFHFQHASRLSKWSMQTEANSCEKLLWLSCSVICARLWCWFLPHYRDLFWLHCYI